MLSLFNDFLVLSAFRSYLAIPIVEKLKIEALFSKSLVLLLVKLIKSLEQDHIRAITNRGDKNLFPVHGKSRVPFKAPW